jgi:hypothetical protein
LLLQHLRQPLRQFRRRPVGSRHEFLDTVPDTRVISSFDRWAAEVLNFCCTCCTTTNDAMGQKQNSLLNCKLLR